MWNESTSTQSIKPTEIALMHLKHFICFPYCCNSFFQDVHFLEPKATKQGKNGKIRGFVRSITSKNSKFCRGVNRLLPSHETIEYERTTHLHPSMYGDWQQNTSVLPGEDCLRCRLSMCSGDSAIAAGAYWSRQYSRVCFYSCCVLLNSFTGSCRGPNSINFSTSSCSAFFVLYLLQETKHQRLELSEGERWS